MGKWKVLRVRYMTRRLIKETYWLLAIKAAREAGRLEAQRTQTVAGTCTTLI